MIDAVWKRVGIGLVIVSVANGASAATLTYDNILGSWCGVKNNPEWANLVFSRDSMTVILLPKNSRVVFKIDHYDFTDTTVFVHYVYNLKGSGRTISEVDYTDFGADGQTMIQAATGQDNIYHFTRCKL